MVLDNTTGGFELSEDLLKKLYSSLVAEAIAAFSVDFHYAAAICAKARDVEVRRNTRAEKLA